MSFVFLLDNSLQDSVAYSMFFDRISGWRRVQGLILSPILLSCTVYMVL